MGFDRDGRELIIVAVKATFTIPEPGAEPDLAEEQAPLTEADEFTGEPGRSAPLYETDYAHRKPCCDVILNGSAYAPAGKIAKRIPVALRVGAMAKQFAVVGDRLWRRGITGITPTEPEPFAVLPFSYNDAFGGLEVPGATSESAIATYMANPVGRGYSRSKSGIEGQRLPNTEEINRPVTDSNGSYRPMSFGVLGRNWSPRVSYVGTYDQEWLDNRAPFWPDDFDYRYFQSTPPDQQIPYPVGGEDVVLSNLTPDTEVRFRLPSLAVPVWCLPYRGADEKVEAVIDTLLIEPDAGRFMLTWRAVVPMLRSCFDLKQMIVGDMSKAWQRARRSRGKPYYRGLAELVNARRGGPQTKGNR